MASTVFYFSFMTVLPVRFQMHWERFSHTLFSALRSVRFTAHGTKSRPFFISTFSIIQSHVKSQDHQKNLYNNLIKPKFIYIYTMSACKTIYSSGS